MNIRAIRLQRQCLSTTKFKTPAEVVRWFGAVQAQDYPAAKWALGQRIKGATEKLIDSAFDKGEILRTHVMRPTWHFVSPENIGWLLKLTGPRVRMRAGHNFRELELDPAILGKSERVLARVLKNRNFLTKAEIGNALAKSGVEPGNPLRLTHILFSAELNGLICSGGRKGKQFTYALLDERTTAGRELTRDESIAEITRLYFRSHGPATLSDFTWWSGLTKLDARAGIDMLKNELSYAELEGKQFWYVAGKIRETSMAHLLPAFDEYLVGYTDRSAALDLAPRSQVGLLSPAVMIDGRVVGTWSREFGKKSGKVVVNSFTKLRQQDWNAIQAAVAKFGEYLDLPCELQPL
jgi:hypothetical protein